MLVMGLDPGLAVTGYGFVEGDGHEIFPGPYGVVRTSSRLPTADRLLRLHERLSDVVARHRPDVVAVEQLFFGINARTAMLVGEARGVQLLALAQAGLQVAEYTPLQVKLSVTGYGRADKAQVQEMVRVLLNLEDVPRPVDAADALAIAICHLHSSGLPEERKPQSEPEASA